MAQVAEAIGSYDDDNFDRDDAFRKAQRRAFKHMGSGWYGPNFSRTVKEGVAQLLAACDSYVDRD
jgi:hypothetical protein